MTDAFPADTEREGRAVAPDPRNGGRMSPTGDLTDQQVAFVRAYIGGGCDATNAARLAGYAHPESAGWRLMQSASIIREVRGQMERIVHGKGVPKAVGFCIAALEDKTMSGSARHACARTILELAGMLGSGKQPASTDPGDKPMEQWSLAELNDFITKGGAQLKEVAAQRSAIPGEAREIARNSDPES